MHELALCPTTFKPIDSAQRSHCLSAKSTCVSHKGCKLTYTRTATMWSTSSVSRCMTLVNWRGGRVRITRAVLTPTVAFLPRLSCSRMIWVSCVSLPFFPCINTYLRDPLSSWHTRSFCVHPFASCNAAKLWVDCTKALENV